MRNLLTTFILVLALSVVPFLATSMAQEPIPGDEIPTDNRICHIRCASEMQLCLMEESIDPSECGQMMRSCQQDCN